MRYYKAETEKGRKRCGSRGVGKTEMNFYERLHIVCNQIPYGTVTTYGQLALLCGKPKNSRQVGYALRMGLAGEVPAHRIINGKGFLSGAGYFENSDTQKKLLEMEGIEAEQTENGYKVDLKRFAWKVTEDEAEAFYYLFHEDGHWLNKDGLSVK